MLLFPSLWAVNLHSLQFENFLNYWLTTFCLHVSACWSSMRHLTPVSPTCGACFFMTTLLVNRSWITMNLYNLLMPHQGLGLELDLHSVFFLKKNVFVQIIYVFSWDRVGTVLPGQSKSLGNVLFFLIGAFWRQGIQS